MRLRCLLLCSAVLKGVNVFRCWTLASANVLCVLQVDEAAYEKLRECVFTSDINVCDDVPSGAGGSGGAKLTNPLGGTAHQVDGADRYMHAYVSVCRCWFGGFRVILNYAMPYDIELQRVTIKSFWAGRHYLPGYLPDS